MIASTLADLEAGPGIAVALDETVHLQLRALCLADLGNGGRGIRNKIEAHLVNPLARALFDADLGSGSQVVVDGLETDGLARLVVRPVVRPKVPL
jgi:ATP-dependent Clp protease ATP-binding subunit ClpA